jgi:hypothetical protein
MAPGGGMAPMGGPTGMGEYGMAGMGFGGPGVEMGGVVDGPKSGLRTALIVAIVVLVMVVLAVVALYLDRRGIIDLGLPGGETPPAAAPAPTSSAS